MDDLHRGGCLCGAIRYSFGAWDDAGFCHCTRCRRFTGGAAAAWAALPAGALRLEAGEPRVHAGRSFCAACGSSLFWSTAAGELRVLLASLDRPERIRPTVHLHVDTQLPWLRLDDLMPAHEGEPPPPGERTNLRGEVDPSITGRSPVTLREITKDNLWAVLALDVSGPQRRFVASNAISLAQAYLAGDAWHRAIHAGERPVGFVMATSIEEDEHGLPTAGQPMVWRFMIDERYQGLGLGGRALALVIEELRGWPGAHSIWVGAVPGTGSALELYRRFGFEDTGVMDESEHILRLSLTA